MDENYSIYIILYIASVLIFYIGYLFTKIKFRCFFLKTIEVKRDKESMGSILILILSSLIPIVNLIIIGLITLGNFSNVKNGKIFRNKKGDEYQYIFARDVEFYIYQATEDLQDETAK